MNCDSPVKLYYINAPQYEKEWNECFIKLALVSLFPLENAKSSTFFHRCKNSENFLTNENELICTEGNYYQLKYEDASSLLVFEFSYTPIHGNNKSARSIQHNFSQSVLNKINFSLREYFRNKGEFASFDNGFVSDNLVSYTHYPAYKQRYKFHKNIIIGKPNFVFTNKFSYVCYDNPLPNHSYVELLYGYESIGFVKSGWQRNKYIVDMLAKILQYHYNNIPPKYSDNPSPFHTLAREIFRKYSTKELDTILINFLVELLNN